MCRSQLFVYFCAVTLYFTASRVLVEGRCSSWSDWSHCSVTCGVGTEYRNRSCVAEKLHKDDCDVGPSVEIKKCKMAVCPVKYEGLGCFKDRVRFRALPILVKNLRSKIDWSKIGDTVRECAELVSRRGYRIFAIQFYGECWSGPDVNNEYKKYGKSRRCWNGVGRGNANYVYEITEQEDAINVRK